MDFYTIWPAFLCVAMVMPIALLPVFDGVGFHIRAGRRSSIDGLRAYLALAVCLHHAVIYHGYVSTGKWASPPSQFYRLLGTQGVSLFFIITAYLFFGRLIGRQVDFRTLMTKRLFRIGPLYFFVVLCAMAFSPVLLPEDIASALGLFRQIAANLAFGIFPFHPLPPDRSCTIVACVTWTLQFEWYFYFSLPIVAVLATTKTLALWASGVAFAVLLVVGSDAFPWPLYALFAGGALCAALEQNGLLAHRINKHLLSAVSVSIFALLIYFYWQGYSPLPVACMVVVFYFVLSGADFFGLLTLRSSIRIGEISYGIYILQGLAIALTYSFPAVRDAAAESPIIFWLTTYCALVLLVFFSLSAHFLIEKPGVAIGDAIVGRLFETARRQASNPEAVIREIGRDRLHSLDRP